MTQTIQFPAFTGTRCLMMPFIQGEPDSMPGQYSSYREIVRDTYLRRGDIGFITIDESEVRAGVPHRGKRAKHGRALHTEAGLRASKYRWGSGPTWGGGKAVGLDWDTRILIASNIEDSCAVWNAEHQDTTADGDIGHLAELYPYADARLLKVGEVVEIGILTPHESLPIQFDGLRQFLRIVGSGVHGREEYFTENPLLQFGKLGEP
jgi:hypothetical protein